MIKIPKQTEDFPESFYAFIEIPMGGNFKYEYNEEIGAIALDRMLYTAMVYPANYGFIPNTKARDGDPLDVLVLTDQPINQGCLVKCRPIGMLYMTDEEGVDNKILAVPVAKVDPSKAHLNDIGDLPQYTKDRVKHFFERYKELEKGKFVKLEGFKGKADAINEIKATKA